MIQGLIMHQNERMNSLIWTKKMNSAVRKKL